VDHAVVDVRSDAGIASPGCSGCVELARGDRSEGVRDLERARVPDRIAPAFCSAPAIHWTLVSAGSPVSRP
jgi:hypothetical protein